MEMNRYQEIFFTNVYRILDADNIPVGKFESDLGYSRGYISRHATGTRNIGFDEICKISDRLGYTVSHLLNPDFIVYQKKS